MKDNKLTYIALLFFSVIIIAVIITKSRSNDYVPDTRQMMEEIISDEKAKFDYTEFQKQIPKTDSITDKQKKLRTVKKIKVLAPVGGC